MKSSLVYHANEFSFFRTQFLSAGVLTSARDFRLKIMLAEERSWVPGQFLMLRWGEHVIGRPFAIVGTAKLENVSFVEIWVRRLGAATEELLTFAEEGKACELLFPLGNSLPSIIYSPDARVLFISGGVGGASILPIWNLRANKEDYWLHGERQDKDFDSSLAVTQLCLEAVSSSFLKAFQGRVTDALLNGMVNNRPTHIVCCGPTKMMEAVANVLDASPDLKKIPCFFGLEEKMGCGIGLCFSCSVKTESGMKRCCTEGPWFERQSIKPHFIFRGVKPRVG